MRNKRVLVAVCAAVIGLSGMLVSTASASPYGPAGLGANLHRRFIIKQGFKKTSRGKSVSGRQIIRLSRPYTNGFIRSRGRR